MDATDGVGAAGRPDVVGAVAEDGAVRAWADLLRRHRAVVALVVLLCVAAAAVAEAVRPDRYTATAQVATSASLSADGSSVPDQRPVADEVRVATSDLLVGQVRSGLGSGATLDADAEEGSTVLSLSATAAGPAAAAEAANAYAAAYVQLRRATAVEQNADAVGALEEALTEVDIALSTATPAQSLALIDQRTALERARTALVVEGALAQQGEARVVAPAQPPTTDGVLAWPWVLLAAAAAGAVIGVAVAAVLDALDRRAHAPEVLAAAAAHHGAPVPVLAVLPGRDGGPLPSRTLRSAVLLPEHGDGSAVVHLTSAAADDGATAVALGLAMSSGAAGHRTVLALVAPQDDDLPGALLGPRPGGGAAPPPEERAAPPLGWLAADLVDAPRVRVLRPTPQEREVLRAGGVDLRRVTGDLRGTADVVVLLTPPVLSSPEAVEVAGAADTTVLVAGLHSTEVGAVRRAAALLSAVGARVDGLVVTDPTASGPEPVSRVEHLQPSEGGRGAAEDLQVDGPDRGATAPHRAGLPATQR